MRKICFFKQQPAPAVEDFQGKDFHYGLVGKYCKIVVDAVAVRGEGRRHVCAGKVVHGNGQHVGGGAAVAVGNIHFVLDGGQWPEILP